mgnify:CR=1 FL=1
MFYVILSSLCLLFSVCFFFFLLFFQAEDCIRDLVRSRGLGDVYKRQHLAGTDADSHGVLAIHDGVRLDVLGDAPGEQQVGHFLGRAVSYTHLTLPTSDLV